MECCKCAIIYKGNAIDVYNVAIIDIIFKCTIYVRTRYITIGSINVDVELLNNFIVIRQWLTMCDETGGYIKNKVIGCCFLALLIGEYKGELGFETIIVYKTVGDVCSIRRVAERNTARETGTRSAISAILKAICTS